MATSSVISVIIPAYNTARYISEALDSVFVQTFKDYEVVVINDGSPDTEELERVLEPYLDRITYLKQENRGPSAARNLGIRQARGEFLAFLDSDDVWMPEYLAEQIRHFRDDPSLDMIYSDAWFFGNTPSAGKTYMQLYPPKSRDVTFENMVAEKCPMVFTHCVLVRRAAVAEVGLFDEELSHSEDLHLWLRLAHAGARIAYHRMALAGRRARAGSLNSSRRAVEQGEVRALEKLRRTLDLSTTQRLLLERRIARRHALVDLREGKQFLAEGNFEQAINSLARANAVFHRQKLGLVLFGLDFAPRLTAWVARIWQAVDSKIEAGLRRLKYGGPIGNQRGR